MWKIPLFDVNFDDAEVKSVSEAILSGWLSSGERVAEFEAKFAEYIGTKHAIAVTTGTAALHLAHVSLGIGPGDEVICPSLHFVAGPNSVVYTGADPVFTDITSLDDLTISPRDIEKNITPKTKAIQVMHFAGYPCDMGAIMNIAARRDLLVIEDACHAIGAQYGNQYCGTIGTIGCFSFFPNKNMTTGEGGMIVTNNPEIAAKIRLLRCHGMTTTTHERHRGEVSTYDVVALGNNYRLDEMRAAMGISQLEKLDNANARRTALAARYRQRLKGVSIPFPEPHGTSSHHIFPMILGEGVARPDFMLAMRDKGIQTSIHYPAAHQLSYYRERAWREVSLPVTEEAASREVTLPLFPTMDVAQVDYICDSVAEILA